MEKEWFEIKKSYPKGRVITVYVLEHKHYGMYVDVGSDLVKGFVPITEIGQGPLTVSEFPVVGSSLKAKIMDYTEDERWEIWLSIKSVNGEFLFRRDTRYDE